jgi:hypothetical protein
MATMFLFDGPAQAKLRILLAHGAAMESPAMTAAAKALAGLAHGRRVLDASIPSAEVIAGNAALHLRLTAPALAAGAAAGRGRA